MTVSGTINRITFRCGLCKKPNNTTLGSRTIIRDSKKIKVCAECAKDLPPPVRRR